MPSSLTAIDVRGAAAASPASGAARPGATVLPGDLVGGRYVVEEVLGSGGMGVVVAARHEALGHRVAMKLVAASVPADADAYVRFSREARIIASLENDHVVRMFDFGMHAGTPYMVMELLAGRDLGRELSMRGPLPIAEAVDWVVQACDGLSAAHAKGIVHRDVKVANLFLAMRPDGERIVKVLDFGVSKLQTQAHDDLQLTRTAATIGSPSYMAPEQVRDARMVDERADIWSLGVVLYKLLTNETPFSGLSANAVCAAIAADPPTPLRARAPHVPERLEAVVLRCLEKSPQGRYASTAALARDLTAFASPPGKLVAEQLVARAIASGVLDSTGESLAAAPAQPPDDTEGASVIEPRTKPGAAPRGTSWGRIATIGAVVATTVLATVIGVRTASRSSATVSPSAAATTVAAQAEAPIAAETSVAAEPEPPVSPTPVAPAVSATSTTPARPPTPRRALPAPRSPVTTPPPAPTPTPHFGGSALDDHH